MFFDIIAPSITSLRHRKKEFFFGAALRARLRLDPKIQAESVYGSSVYQVYAVTSLVYGRNIDFVAAPQKHRGHQ